MRMQRKWLKLKSWYATLPGKQDEGADRPDPARSGPSPANARGMLLARHICERD